MAECSDAGFVQADGCALEYRWLGPAPDVAPTLVFLHEGLGCVAMWKDFPEQVSAATGCLAAMRSSAPDPAATMKRFGRVLTEHA